MTDDIPPQFTIAIPTFRRPDQLRIAIKSAIEQNIDVPYEVLVVDNDPQSTFSNEIEAIQVNATSARLRYIRNDENIGMFGNWNKCLDEASSEWMTLLCDDDALHPDFLKIILPYCTNECVAIAVGKLEFSTETNFNASSSLQTHSAKHISFKKVNAWLFDLFNPIGIPAGFSFNRENALAIGGYETSFYPSSDYYFAKRLAQLGTVIMTRRKLAFVGIGENASMRVETLSGFFEKDIEIRAIKSGALNRLVGLMNIDEQGRQFGFSVSEIIGTPRHLDVPLRGLGFVFRILKWLMLRTTCRTWN